MFTAAAGDTSSFCKGEFNRPVESIMKCEDFKSNFARRLSNRYIARSPPAPVGLKKEGPKPVLNKKQEADENVPETAEPTSLLIKKNKTDLKCEVVKPSDVTPKSEVKSVEVAALNMEVETLKWQLAQTETNRQMHLALLKRIVSFLNRVKEHMETKKEASPPKGLPARMLPMSVDLPRSRSVTHFNKNLDCVLSSGKKLNSRKISKSITNVNGFKDSNISWNQSKLSLTSENDFSKKISEEITRLITLANTVLSTKIPDLTCSCNGLDSFKISKENLHNETNKTQTINNGNECLDHVVKNDTSEIPNLSTSSNNSSDNDGIVIGVQEKNQMKQDDLPLHLLHDIDPGIVNLLSKDEIENISVTAKSLSEGNGKMPQNVADKGNHFNRVSIFMEDESGFSSMSSFQEIGIPIINIIPPTPSKDDVFLENEFAIANETDGWKNIPLGINSQAVKVFWV